MAVFARPLVMLVHCAGGGSSGAGVRGYQGSVVLSDSSDAVAIQVELVETGEKAVTDESGGYPRYPRLP